LFGRVLTYNDSAEIDKTMMKIKDEKEIIIKQSKNFIKKGDFEL